MVDYSKLSSFVGRSTRTSACLVLFALFSLCCLSVVVLISPVLADESMDLAFIRRVNPITTPKQREVVRFNLQEISELKFAATGLIRLYQKFISSQDGPTCNFSPTCSRFGMACIQEYGIFVAVLISPGLADESMDLAFIRSVNPITIPKQREVVRFNLQETSELKLAATGLIRLYQKFISSQDAPTCNFSPTCSRFGMACIQEYGMARGILLTADRLLRCNGSQSRHYHKDAATGKYIDSVSDYAKLK